MSLDVWLYRTLVVKATKAEFTQTIYEGNITHNLNEMAIALDCYYACWRPEEIGITTAEQVIPFLKIAIARLNSDPDLYKKYEPENGWGTVNDLKRFLTSYLQACESWPYAEVGVSR